MDTDTARYEPATHYDHVHEAWRLIMGEEFHYGYFESPDTPLPRATATLTEEMIDPPRGSPPAIACSTWAAARAARPATWPRGLVRPCSGSPPVPAAWPRPPRWLRRGTLPTHGSPERDGTDNGLGDGSFDVTWALESSHLMRDRKALLGECTRVLAPGGRFVLCDIVRKREIPFTEVRARRDDFATLPRRRLATRTWNRSTGTAPPSRDSA